MAIGDGGKYDDVATYVRATTQAEAVVVIVLGGSRGSSFAVQMAVTGELEAAETAERLAAVLRQAASSMEIDATRLRLRVRKREVDA
jgi:hypothetical protein